MASIQKISIICAIDEHRALGKDNKLIWDIPEDMKFFREKTLGHSIIMGRKTFESIGRPLPQRINIIITRSVDYKAEGCFVVNSLKEAIKLAKKKDDKEMFIVGGGQIYEQGMAIANTMYLTIVKGKYEADTYFPDYSDWEIVKKEDLDNGEYEFSFVELRKK